MRRQVVATREGASAAAEGYKRQVMPRAMEGMRGGQRCVSLPLSWTKGWSGGRSIGAMIDNNGKAMARWADHHYSRGEDKVA